SRISRSWHDSDSASILPLFRRKPKPLVLSWKDMESGGHAIGFAKQNIAEAMVWAVKVDQDPME
ncbi:MAG TPA: hypothetical protein PK942_14010, partial [Verrucomicrobiota bacterium]|nr:hypothetical protein [Verrucomicrobiota bacterium]